MDFVQLSVDSAADGAGAATDTVARSGQIVAVGIDYHAGTAVGTDVVISVANRAGPALPILTVTNNKTDGWYYPRASAVSPTNAPITNSHVPIAFHGQLSAAVAEAGGALTAAVKVVIFYDDGQ